MAEQDHYDDYDQEPVEYCARCYSLKIKYEDIIDSACCMDCGCSDTLTSSIEDWEKLYEKRYGGKYVNRVYDPKKSPIFKMSNEKLKERVYESPHWLEIIHTLYPQFPKGLGKADSILFLFEKLVKDNRMDDLKLLLIKFIKEKRTWKKRS